MDWLLLFPYLLIQALLTGLFLMTGGLLTDRLSGPPAGRTSGVFRLCLAYAAGLAAFSFLATLLGLAGLLNRPAAGMSMFGLLALGIGDMVRRRRLLSTRISQELPRPAWMSAWRDGLPDRLCGPHHPEIWAKGAVILYGAAIAGWLIVGAAAPDVGQDSMWYHLSVPRAWVQRGRITAFPLNMPSNYALGFEAIYAVVLLFSDEVSCSLLYAQVMLATLLAIVGAAASLYGRLAGWLAAAFSLTLFAASNLIIPIGASNDFAAMLLMLLALLILASPKEILGIDAAGWRVGALAGMLAGAAFSVKIVTAGFVLPFLAWTMIAAARRGALLACTGRSNLGRLGRPFFAAFLVFAFLVYLPWAARNVVAGCGNPLFPFGQRLLPHRPEYDAVVAASAQLNSLFPLTPAGVIEALADLYARAECCLAAPDIMTPVLLLVMLIGLAVGRGSTRRLSHALLFQVLVLLMMRGRQEVFRYFALCQPAAVIVGAGLLSRAWRERVETRRILRLGLVAILVAGAATYWSRQLRWLAFDTIAWPGRPSLTRQSRLEYAKNKEAGGPLMEPFELLSRLLPKEARVLMADCGYPYYLDRYVIWSCIVMPPPISCLWQGRDAPSAARWLSDHAITHILFLAPPKDPRIAELQKRGHLTAVSFNEADQKLSPIQVFVVNRK